MKHGGFKIICLILMACITVFSISGQDKTVAWETRILESFNGEDDSPYVWKTQASRFISPVRDANGEVVNDNSGNAQRYPTLAYIEAWPVAVFGYGREPNAPTIKSLGLHGKFDRRGYNWIDLYPVLKENPDDPFEIHIPGRVSNMDVWVWGANLRYYIEIYVRDFRGVVHSLKLGDISYQGWRNLRVNIPSSIPQARRTLPSYAGLTFVKFRIWTQPVERVDDLADPSHVDRLWSSSN